MHSVNSQIYKQVQRTYVDALVKASFLTPNLGGGLTITALPPVFPASLTLELLAGRVVPVPFDGSTVVEGTVYPTTAAFPDVVIHDILAARLFLVACEEPRRFLTVDRVPFGCPAWVSVLGLGLYSPSESSPATSSCICSM